MNDLIFDISSPHVEALIRVYDAWLLNCNRCACERVCIIAAGAFHFILLKCKIYIYIGVPRTRVLVSVCASLCV